MARQMKDSGIEWIGEIPEDWTIAPLQYHADLNTESLGEDTAPDYEFDYVEIGSVTLEGGINEYEHVQFANAPSRARRIVKENDIIVSTVRTYLKAIAIVPARENVIVSTGFAVLTPKNIDVDFLGFFLKSEYFVNMVTANSVGISYPAINASDLIKFKILLPSIEEQHRIADFLDRKCAEIDAVIERTKATIEEYKKLKQAVITEAVTKGVRGARKMKDSGIEWIGEIPEEWRLAKMHHISATITDYVASGSFASLAENVVYLDEPDYAMLVRTMDVSGKGYSGKPVYINQHAYEFLSNSNLFGGEIMLPNIGASVGDVYLVPKLYERMSLAPNAIMLRTNICDKFVYYYFMGNSGRLSVLDIAESTAQPKFNKTDFRQLRIPLPINEEQEEIVAYLDEKCAALDTLIAKKTALLTELETYKKSLIYEYVTGKKEVM